LHALRDDGLYVVAANLIGNHEDANRNA